MKNGKKLIILLAVLVVFIGAYIAISNLSSGESDTSGSSSSAEADSIVIFESLPDDIIKIEWSNDVGSSCISRATSMDPWIWSEDETLELDDSYIESMLDSICCITADSSFDAVGTESEYGFDKPLTTVKFTLEGSGKEHTVRVGNYNSSAGCYYLSFSGSDKMFTVASTGMASNFLCTAYDIRVVEEDSTSETSSDSSLVS